MTCECAPKPPTCDCSPERIAPREDRASGTEVRFIACRLPICRPFVGEEGFQFGVARVIRVGRSRLTAAWGRRRCARPHDWNEFVGEGGPVSKEGRQVVPVEG